MAIGLRQPQTRAAAEPVALPARRTKLEEVAAWLVISVLTGLVAGAVLNSLVTAEEDTTRAAQIQALRAEAMVEAYGRAWVADQPAVSQVRVTGTGPALAWLAEQQTAWTEHAITGTGPGLVTVAQLQAGYGSHSEPTGTGPGLANLPGRTGPEVAVIGTP